MSDAILTLPRQKRVGFLVQRGSPCCKVLQPLPKRSEGIVPLPIPVCPTVSFEPFELQSNTLENVPSLDGFSAQSETTKPIRILLAVGFMRSFDETGLYDRKPTVAFQATCAFRVRFKFLRTGAKWSCEETGKIGGGRINKPCLKSTERP